MPPVPGSPRFAVDFFPTTRWSRILALRSGRDRSGDLDQLARAYEGPIRSWLRAFRKGEHDLDDLAQGFLVWVIETRFFERADPARGRFRGFLKTALRHFVIDHDRRQRALKHGGGRTELSLDSREAAGAIDPATPDRELDRSWRAQLVERAALELERELVASGRRTHYLLFRDYFLGEQDVGDQRALGARHGLDEIGVANHLRHAKRRFRAILRRAVVETVTSPDELASELAWLFGEVDP